MRFPRGDVRGHIVSNKNDHGASYRRYRLLPRRSWRRPKFVREISRPALSTYGLCQLRLTNRKPKAAQIRRTDSPMRGRHRPPRDSAPGQAHQAALLVYLAQLFFQVSDQFLDPLRGVRVRRDLPGQLAVSQNLHFQFDAFVF